MMPKVTEGSANLIWPLILFFGGGIIVVFLGVHAILRDEVVYFNEWKFTPRVAKRVHGKEARRVGASLIIGGLLFLLYGFLLIW